MRYRAVGGTKTISLISRLLLGASLWFCAGATMQADSLVSDGTLSATLSEQGTIHDMTWKRAGSPPVNIAFRHDRYAGFSWHVHTGGQWHVELPLARVKPGADEFATTLDGVVYSLTYAVKDGRLEVVAGVRNTSGKVFTPTRVLVNVGVDTEMVSYPSWHERFSPTLLRCETTHFWGYFMRPDGVILGIASPDPVVSWANGYNAGGHRIFTSCLDFFNTDPQPERHPQVAQSLGPGEARQWRVLLAPMDSLATVQPTLAKAAGIPMIALDRPTVEAGQPVKGVVASISPVVSLSVTGPDSNTVGCELRDGKFLFMPPHPGVYTLTLKTRDGKVTEAKAARRMPWSWYAKGARANAVSKPQKASSHTESWYGLFSAYLARRYFPDATLDVAIDAKYNEIAPLLYDTKKLVPTSWESRIQNHACWGSMQVARYRATGDIHALEFAAAMADYMAATQTPTEPAYYARSKDHAAHYTCVVYIAKSVLEVMAAEKPLVEKDPSWKARYDRHAASVRRALDDLAARLDNIGTEGEATYEDGMISCAYMQLAMYALLQTDAGLREKYLAAAKNAAAGHRCLSQILVPDCRMNGGSLRFWESQYDIETTPNMMISPHGWSAWRLYGLWYLYQLTGEREYLRQAMNGLASCVQLIDFKTGDLRWGFIADPCIRARVFEPNPVGSPPGRWVERVIGEQYLPMISGWYRAKPNTLVNGYFAMGGGQSGGCCDNDVHEIFKCLGEIALTSAYVVEHSDGSLETWNCTAQRDGQGVIEVMPAEAVVSRVHFNLTRASRTKVKFTAGDQTGDVDPMSWFGPGGIPEELR
jgi:hypothetical protein